MFLLNLGYRWGSGFSLDVDGYVINPSGINKEQAARRDNLDLTDTQCLLFDPQMYLSILDGAVHSRTCENLATYPWFGVETPTFNSSEMNTRDWMSQVREQVNWHPVIPTDENNIRNVIRECVEFQKEFGATHLIVPTPLVDNDDDEFGTQLKWLNAAADLKGRFSQPMFATVAISDYLLSARDPHENPLLQTILDNISVSDFEGAYVVVLQADAPRVRITSKRIAQSLLFMSRVIQRSSKAVFINYADDLGHACIAAGATGFASGTSFKSRRLCLSDFEDRTGGSTFPRLYSHSLIGDFSMEDLGQIRDERLLRYIGSDATPIAEPLYAALKARGSAHDVPAWRPSKNNVTAANKHRVMLMAQKARELVQLDETAQLNSVLHWLQEAEAHGRLLASRFSDNPLDEDGTHVEVWGKAFQIHLDTVEPNFI